MLSLFEEKRIANALNNFFINSHPDLADDIPTAKDLSETMSKKLIKK